MEKQSIEKILHGEDLKKPKTNSRGLLLSGLFTFLILFLGVGIWMYSASIQGAIIASGQVAVTGKPQVVQHKDGGIISEILAENGQEVAAGDVLIRLDDTVLSSSLDILKNRFQEYASQRDRLLAERDAESDIKWNDETYTDLNIQPDHSYRQAQSKIFKARKKTQIGQTSQLGERVNQLEHQISGVSALSDSKAAQIESLQEEFISIENLAKDGYAPKSRVRALQRQIDELTGQQFGRQAEIARIRDTISEVKIQKAQVIKEFNQSVLTELSAIELNLKDTTQRIISTQDQLSRIDIRSPISGVVHEQKFFTIGGVITPGAQLLDIIPQGKDMEFEVKVEPQYIDQIHSGQDVSILFSSFNARTTPQINGSVEHVSLNTSIHEATGIAYYPVRVTIETAELERLGDQALISGMPIEAFFTTESRSPLNYLLKPLTDNVNRALREE
jgi:HlyD family secretion protein